MFDYEYPALKELADKLQFAEFLTEYTLDIKSGDITESDTLGISDYLYANDYGSRGWVVDYQHATLPDNSEVKDSLFAPCNYMSYGTLWEHLGDVHSAMNDYSRLVVTLSPVDTYDCDECDVNGMSDYCDHSLGWVVISALIP